MKKPLLIRYFTLYSLIAFAITGILLAFFVSAHIKNDKIDHVKDLALLSLDTAIKPGLIEGDFASVLSGDKAAVMAHNVEKVMKNTSIIRINIINRDLRVIYSNHSKMVGNHVQHEKFLNDVFCNKTVYKIVKPDKGGDSSIQEAVIKFYSPMVFDGKVTGIFEVYVPYHEVQHHIVQLNTLILLTIFIGLVLLYLLLINILKKTSHTLVQQNQALLSKTRELEQSYSKLNESYKTTIITLSKAVDARDAYTAGHSERVTEISLQIGHTLGLSEQQLEILEQAALFHDIGKLGIPDEVLHKPGKLNDMEYHTIKKHPEIGVKILENIDFLSSALPIIKHHHEKFAGNGYPAGIGGDSIPLEARIIAVADTYDAMTSDRPYRKGLPHEIAVNELIKYQDIQFDRNVVQAFLKVMQKDNMMDDLSPDLRVLG